MISIICMTFGRLEKTIVSTSSETTNGDSLLSGTFKDCGCSSPPCPFTCATFFEDILKLGMPLTALALLCGPQVSRLRSLRTNKRALSESSTATAKTPNGSAQDCGRKSSFCMRVCEERTPDDMLVVTRAIPTIVEKFLFGSASLSCVVHL